MKNTLEKTINKRNKYKFNKNFFDIIDSEEKAYWLGFIWCDGYLMNRTRLNSTEYAFKLDLMKPDYEHLCKFNESMESNYPIKIYKNGKGSFSKGKDICRIHISVKHFGYTLFDKYGMFANRTDVSKLKSQIPENLMNHFIRGVLDADGSFSYYTDKKTGNKKAGIGFTTYEDLAKWINIFLYEKELCKSILTLSVRHEELDKNCKKLIFSGINQSQKILDYLYNDASIYLERKFIKYQELVEFNK